MQGLLFDGGQHTAGMFSIVLPGERCVTSISSMTQTCAGVLRVMKQSCRRAGRSGFVPFRLFETHHSCEALERLLAEGGKD